MAGPKQSQPLGEYLLAQRLCTPEQIERALNAQVVYGGKLGTVLLEQGAIDLRALAKALGKIHHVRALDPMQPIKIPENIIKALPPKLAKQHQAVAFALEGRRLYVLILDPTNRRALEGISLATRKEVVPVVLPEVRLRLLLERYYGIEQDLRYLTLAKKLAENGGRLPQQAQPAAKAQGGEDLMPEEVFNEQLTQMAAHKGDSAEEAVPSPAPPAASISSPGLTVPAMAPSAGLQVVDRASLAAEEEDAEVLDILDEEIIPLGDDEEEDWAVYMGPEQGAPVDLPVDSSFESSAAQAQEEEPEEAGPPPLAPAALPEASALLEKSADRNDIARAVLQLAMGKFKRAVLFSVRGGAVSGWDAFGDGVNLPLMRSLIVSLNQPSTFKLVCDTKAHFLGKLQPGEINDGFLKLLGGPDPKSAFIYPILFRGKVVNLIYADGGPGKNAPVDVTDLLLIGPKVPQAFERILKAKKQKRPGAPGVAAATR